MVESPPAASVPSLARPRRGPRMQETGLLVVIVILSIFLWLAAKPVTVNPANPVQENGFFRADNLLNSVFTVMSWMAIMAIGETIVIITGGIDISVGSMMGLAAFVTALVLRNFAYEAPWWQVLPVGIGVPVGVGLLCGLFNGAIVVGLRMHPFIVSLASLSIFRWVSLKLGVTYGQSQPGNLKLPSAFTDGFIALPFKHLRMGGAVIEIYEFIPIVIMLIVLVAGWVYLRHTVWGRETYAIGGNEEAARYSGIRVGWTKMRVYILCGLCAGIAGMLTCGKYKSAQTTTGDGYELNVIAAAVVGGASLTGGRGTALGAVLGMLVIQLIEDGIFVVGNIDLGFVNIPVVKEDTKLIMGAAILIAVGIDHLSSYLQSRRSALVRSAAH
jgi:ribose/xylose/arabinose/galactoside ABC-type transport system permease subunit